MAYQARLGRLYAAVLGGVEATIVTVEVHRDAGLPRQTIVGLPSTAVRQSLERIRAACKHSGLHLQPRRTTVNLAPASHANLEPGSIFRSPWGCYWPKDSSRPSAWSARSASESWLWMAPFGR